MRVALHHGASSSRYKRQAQGMISLRSAIGQNPGSLSSVRLRGQLLCPLIWGGRGTQVDPLYIEGDVEQQSVLADGRAQPGIGAFASLVTGHVEPGRTPEAVGRHGL